jgi:hypothetical protein
VARLRNLDNFLCDGLTRAGLREFTTKNCVNQRTLSYTSLSNRHDVDFTEPFGCGTYGFLNGIVKLNVLVSVRRDHSISPKNQRSQIQQISKRLLKLDTTRER